MKQYVSNFQPLIEFYNRVPNVKNDIRKNLLNGLHNMKAKHTVGCWYCTNKLLD